MKVMREQNKLFQAGFVHGIPVNISNMEKALVEVETLISFREHHYVCFFEGNLFVRSLHEKDVHDVIAGASLIYPDGIVVAKELGWNIKQPIHRVSGPSFILRACEYGEKRKWRHFFLGGANGVAQKLAENLKSKYPEMLVAGCYTPPFGELTAEEERQIKQMIEESHTDLLWVALGGPKQEFWMRKYLHEINVPVMLGVGAAFDFHSGNRPWAPPVIRKIGAEWLYRTVTGGKKTSLRNIKCIFQLIFILFFDRISCIFSSPQKTVSRMPKTM